MTRTPPRLALRYFVTVGTLMSTLAVSSLAAAAKVRVVSRDPADPFVARLVPELRQVGFEITFEPLPAREAAVVEITDVVELRDVSPDGADRRRRLAAPKSDPLKVAEEVRALLLPLVVAPSTEDVGRAGASGPLDARTPSASTTSPSRAPHDGTDPSKSTARSAARSAIDDATATDRPRSRSVRAWEISAGAAALLGAAKPGAGVVASSALFPSKARWGRTSFGVSLSGLIALLPEQVSTSAGSADIRALLVGPEGIARVDVGPRIKMDFALGVWATLVRFSGNANAPLTSRDESAWTVSPGTRLRGQVELGAVAPFIEGRAGVALPEIAVRFAGESVAVWGRPWAAIGAGAAIGF